MDYKYIEQLLERYWSCDTSREEEQILRTFFSQADVPAELERYRSLFVYEQRQADLHLGEDFDRRVLVAVGAAAAPAEAPLQPEQVKARRITLTHRLRPLYRAAAAVAVVTLLGTAAQHSFSTQSDGTPGTWDYNQAAYKDSYDDPQKAYEAGMQALEMFKQGPKTAVADTAAQRQLLPGLEPATRD